MARMRESKIHLRRSNWWGCKPLVKSVLVHPLVNRLMRSIGRRFLPLSLLQRLPINEREVVGHAQGARFVMLEPHRCTNAKELFWGEGRLPDASEQLSLAVFAALARHSDLVIDVGAYTGMFTVAALTANPEARGLAFEMMAETHQLLVANCLRNGLGDRVSCYNVAVGRTTGSAWTPPLRTRSSLPTGLSLRDGRPGGRRLNVIELDRVKPAIIPVRAVMKIDVEGSEADVIVGARETIRRLRPDLLCEVRPGNEPLPLRDLRSLGYRFWLVTAGALEGASEITAHPRHRNWLLSSRPSGELMNIIGRVDSHGAGEPGR